MSVVDAEVQSVAVQGDVTLRLSVQGAEDGASASFEIKKVADDSAVTTIQGEVKEGSAVAEWDPDLTPEGEARSLRVYYVVTVADQTLRSPELEVYLDFVEVESIDEQGAPLPDVPYRLAVGEVVREGTTGSTGKARESGLPAGDVVFDWRGPFQLVEWVDETGPTRKAKLKRVNRFAFAWPNPESNGGRRAWQDDGTEVELDPSFHAWTQWVNLPRDPGTELGRASGPKLTCVVRAAEPENARKGDKVYVKVEWPGPDSLSKRDDPEAPRQLVDGGDQPWAQGDTQKGLALELDADGGQVTFDVLLGLAGGDQVTIHVGGSDRCEDARLVVTNRRKVYVQTTRMEHHAAPDLAPVAEWLAPAAIEVEQQGDDQLVKDAPEPAGPPGERGLARVPAGWLAQGAEGEALVVGQHNVGWLMKKFKDPGARTRTVHLVLADQIIWGTQQDAASCWSQLFRVTLQPETDPTTGEPVLSAFLPLPVTQNFEMFPQALGDGGPPVRDAQWKIPNGRAVPRALRMTQGPLDPSWVRVDRHRRETRSVDGQEVELDGRYGVWLSLPPDSDPARALQEGVEVKVAGFLYPGFVGISGMSYQFQVVALTDAPPEVSRVILAHELGHSMRQVASVDEGLGELRSRYFYLPPGLDFADHPTAYQGKGHVGGHCWQGLDEAATHVLVPGDPPAYEALSGAAHEQEDYRLLRRQESGQYVEAGGSCVMYGSVAAAETSVGFCEACTTFLKAVALEDLHKGNTAAIMAASAPGEETPQPPPPKLRVQLMDGARKPCANASYELTLPSGRSASGSTDANGWLEQDLKEADYRDAACTLKYTPPGGDEVTLGLRLTAAMDTDCESDAVFLAHLRNLGFGGPDDADHDVVSRFQEAMDLPPTGTLDDATKDRIDELQRTDDSLEPVLNPTEPDDEESAA